MQKSSKWANKSGSDVDGDDDCILKRGNKIYINDASVSQNEVQRSLEGKFVNGVNATITLSQKSENGPTSAG